MTKELKVYLRNCTKSDLLELSDNFRIISWIHHNSYYSNILFLTSIILGVLIGIIVPIVLSLVTLSHKASIFLIVGLLILLTIFVFIIIYQMRKSKLASDKMSNFADAMLEKYFPLK